jgi:RNA polymerase sigma-70 factor, ECF subfamily
MVEPRSADLDDASEAEALTALFASVNRQLRARLRRLLGNQADADEVAQEAWLQVWSHRDRIRENPEGFLFITALNLASKRRQGRAAKSTVALEEGQAERLADMLTPEQWVASRQELDLVAREFSQLPPLYQQIVLASLDGEGQASIADSFGVSQATVSRYLGKALKLFRRARAGKAVKGRGAIPLGRLHKTRG